MCVTKDIPSEWSKCMHEGLYGKPVKQDSDNCSGISIAFSLVDGKK